MSTLYSHILTRSRTLGSFEEDKHPRDERGRFSVGGVEEHSVESVKSKNKARIDELLTNFETRHGDTAEGHAGKEVLSNALTDENHKLIAKDGDGNVVGALSYYVTPDNSLRIENLGSTGEMKGVGTELMRQALTLAEKRGYGLELTAMQGAKTFYDRLGVPRSSTSPDAYKANSWQVSDILRKIGRS